MLEQETFLNRIGRLFRRPSKPNGDGVHSDETQPAVTVETHTLSLRPWRRNSAAISQLQTGFRSITELMDEIRQNMVNQNRRQDELLAYLAALPKLMESIPESNRLQGETLKAIQEQLKHHVDQQGTLGEILEKLSETGGDQKDLLEGLCERVETLNHQDKAMADSLSMVSTTLESASRHSAAGTEVLQSLRENLKSRDTDLEAVLHRQNVRFTTLLIVAISVSVAALVAVGVIGFLILHRGMK